MLTTTLSSKGQIIIPSTLRAAHHWEAGTEFVIVDTGDGVLLKPRKPFPATSLEDGLGCAGYAGPAKSLEEIELGVTEAIRRQWADEAKVIAVDTNVLVRYLTNDDAEQARRALALLGNAEGVFVAKTVLLETEWVLRAVYALSPEAIRKALLHVCGLPNVAVEDGRAITHALDAYAQGLDFADALHCASSPGTETFYTFDEKLVRGAAKLGLAVVSAQSI